MHVEVPVSEKATAVMTIGEALQATGGSLVRGASDSLFYGVSTDSRTLQEGNLFVCLRGDNFDGHRFLAAAGDAGASGFVVQKDAADCLMGIPRTVPVVVVEDSLMALGHIARFWRRKVNVPVIAITGSSGKTTTKEMTAEILNFSGKVLKTEGNYNNRVGLPMTLFRLSNRHDVAVVEMGTNMPGEIACLTQIAEPRIGLITNIGAAHLEGLKTLTNIREEKGALFEHMNKTGTAITNRDDKALAVLVRRWRGPKITFGRQSKADVSARDIHKVGSLGMSFRMRVQTVERQVTMQVSGEHNLYNALGAAAAALAFGVNIDSICRGLECFRGVPGRFEVRRLKNGVHVIDDTYNANPLSVREALKALKELHGGGNSVVILGDMLELGGGSYQWHRRIGRLTAETGVNSLFLTGDYRQATAEGAMEKGMTRERIIFFETPEQIEPYLHTTLKSEDWVLVKGSRKMRMERIVQMMTTMFGFQGRTVA